ncbi:MAG: BREX-2 system adenine-specific DNA-methyltransferase PglX, partial [Planctomycetia bacterium]
MINRQSLLSDLQKLLQKLEADLLDRSMSAEVPEVGVRLKEEHARATKAQRTAQNYEDWRTDAITQAAAAWVLSCVFVRFLEDNRLIDPPKISGPSDFEPRQPDFEPRPSGSGPPSTETPLPDGRGSIRNRSTEPPLPDGRGSIRNRLSRARDEHELYFRKHPKQTDREYLLSIFDQLAKLPGTKDVFGEHNPIRELPNWLSGDAAGELLKFFQKIDANTGALVHDFTDSNWDTRFLGDLYQDLSEAARKKYALLQTPDFVEEFILDRTLEPALDEFGLEPHAEAQRREEDKTNASSSLSAFATLRESLFKMIDPACGSGHFLLGSFPRILDRWMKKDPGTNMRELVQRTLDSIHGVDVNPFAIAIARFRLLLAALKACGIQRLADTPAFEMNLVCGDSLLHAPLSGGQKVLDFELTEDSDECDHAYRSENLPELKRLLRGGQYHAVVANPPYIVPRDKQLNDRYRKRFASCHRQYSLSVPFMERIFRLATVGGHTGQITSNSFMKREFGKKLIESFFPTVDLTHVIDTSGAYIPGHGTPTVILLGRHRKPVSSTLRTVLGMRGEPSPPADPARGLVWSAIRALADEPGGQSEFVSAGDSERALFHKHPWSIGGGGAAELKVNLDEGADATLGEKCDAICSICLTREDEAYLVPISVLTRRGIRKAHCIPSIQGDQIRDWLITDPGYSLFPYDANLAPEEEKAGEDIIRFLWERREFLWRRREPNGDHRELKRTWWEWSRFLRHRLVPRTSIAMAFVATHNHFIIDYERTVFNRSAPVIKLLETATHSEYLGLLGNLNSSVGCFW